VHFCHGWLPWEELPLRHPSVRTYVAVDEVCLDRLVREEGIPPERTEVLLNFVDLERFRPRAPLPPAPSRALVFSNAATTDGYARVIAAACAARGMSLDIVGLRHGNPTDAPEALLGAYDLVFAKGRAALEAMAVGCAVVLADHIGCGPLVTPDNFDRLRARNFGIRELDHAHDSAWYGQQIAAYRADRAASVCSRVRGEAGMEAAVDRLLAIYTAAMAAPPAAGDAARAAAEHLRRLAGPFKQSRDLSLRVQELSHDLEMARAEAALNLATALDHGRALQDQLDHGRALQNQIAAYRALPALRVRDAVLRLPLAGSILRASARTLARLLRL
jgi:hypothetical protein